MSDNSSTNTSNTSNGGMGIAKGVVKTVHGLGEVIRGNINSLVEDADGGSARRDGNAPVSASGQRGTDVAAKGAAEFREGMAALRGRRGAGNNVDSSATTGTHAVPGTASATAASAVGPTSHAGMADLKNRPNDNPTTAHPNAGISNNDPTFGAPRTTASTAAPMRDTAAQGGAAATSGATQDFSSAPYPDYRGDANTTGAIHGPGLGVGGTNNAPVVPSSTTAGQAFPEPNTATAGNPSSHGMPPGEPQPQLPHTGQENFTSNLAQAPAQMGRGQKVDPHAPQMPPRNAIDMSSQPNIPYRGNA